METSAGSPVAVLGRGAAWRASLRRRAWLGLVLSVVILSIPSDGYVGAARLNRAIYGAVTGERFDLVSWEVQAIGQKSRDHMRKPGDSLSPGQKHDLVLEYMEGIRRVAELASEIEVTAAGVGDENLAQELANLQSELDALRLAQEGRRPIVERILEAQVTRLLDELAFTALGQVLPPVSFQFTESPNYLILSPRERIQVERGVYLDPAMPLSRIEEIEAEVATKTDRSTIIEGTGGFSSYPTMVLQHSSLSWVIDTIAHEWAHTYLMLQPLGWNYDRSGGMRTINETVASIFGEEVSSMVTERYYPDLTRPFSWPRPLSMRPDWLSASAVAPRFDFGTFMRETRLKADKLLTAGKVSEAEQYMEARRLVLLEQGYGIRKLNQAYFAFHGSYAVGTSATDPIGGKLAALRLRSGNLPEFVRIVAQFNDATDLDAALMAE